MTPLRNRCVVLLSGGWDSIYCALVAIARKHDPVGLFVRYGQPYQQHEVAAIGALRPLLPFDIVETTFETMPIDGSGVFDRRNAWLVAHAMKEGAASVYFGSRCPLPLFDRYGDSNWLWARAAARVFARPIYTPATLLPKAVIRARVRRAGIPTSAVFSTEGWKPAAL